MKIADKVKLLDAVHLLAAAGTHNLFGAGSETLLVLDFSAGLSAGEVVVEEALDAAYAGEWSNVTTVPAPVTASQVFVRIDGPTYAVRARVTTALVGGTVSAYLSAVS